MVQRCLVRLLSHTDYTDADNYNALMLGKYGLFAQKVQNKVLELWMEGTDHTWDGYIIRYLKNKVRINTNSLFTDGCELGANFSTDGNASVKWNSVNNHMTSFLLIDNNCITSLYITGKQTGATELSKKSEYAAPPVLDTSSATLKVTLIPWSIALLICFDPVTIS